jgi:cyclopropane fatty-acyl-phospholipid synthase-like methyltransferase
MSGHEKTIVRTGYDAIAERYLSWSEGVVDDPRARFSEELIRRLPGRARVLDLGCGAGLPSTRLLAEQFEVVGVDVSEVQLELARKNVPAATFIRGDFSELVFPERSFDGIAAFYSISHVPREEHARLFSRVAGWLKPRGLFLATLGADDSPDWTGEWLGAEMFFSSHGADENRRLLRDAGLSLVLDEIVAMREPEGEVRFLWVLAQKPAA